jgi:phage-related protein
MASLALAFDILARDKASKTFKDVGNAADDAGKKGDGFGKKMRSGMGIAAVGLAGIGAAAIAGLGEMVKQGAESARIGRITEAVVKSTGGAAKISAAQVGDLATAISNKTGADDEAIQSGANMLLTFTNVKNEVGKGNDIFNQATQTITDMSAALGTDTKASAIQLGKALNDPIKGVTALQKVGVSFTADQKKQIKTLVDSGKTMDAQKVILKELGKEFGGAAEAASDPMTRLSVIAGNLAEQIGQALMPYIGQFADWVSNKAIPAVSGFVDWLGPKLGPVIDGVKRFFMGMVSQGGPVRSVFDNIVNGVKNLVAGWQNGTGAGGQMRDIFNNLVAIGKNVGDIFVKIKDNVAQFITEFQNGTGAGGKFRDILKQVGDVVQSVTKWIADNRTVVQAVVVAVTAGIGAFKVITGVVRAYTVVQGILNAVMAANPIGIVIIAIAALVAGLIYAYNTSETFRSYVSTAFSMVKIGALTLAKVAVTAFQFLANVFMTVVGAILDGAAKAFGWVPGIGPKLQGAAAEFGKFKDSANAKLDAIKNDIDVKINTEQANIALEALHREFINKGWTVTAQANVKMVYAGGGQLVPAHASGGPVGPGLHVVGDNPDGSWNPTTELLAINGNGRVYNQSQIKLGAEGGGAGPQRLHPHDIALLADAMSRTRPVATITRSNIDRDLGRGRP